MLNEGLELLGLWFSWVKTKIQAFIDVLDDAILSAPVCGEGLEVTERFTSLGSDIHISAGCEPEFNRRLGRAWESWFHWIMGCGAVGTCAGGRKSESSVPWCFQSYSMDVRLGL